jgi:hypothetical protein
VRRISGPTPDTAIGQPSGTIAVPPALTMTRPFGVSRHFAGPRETEDRILVAVLPDALEIAREKAWAKARADRAQLGKKKQGRFRGAFEKRCGL